MKLFEKTAKVSPGCRFYPIKRPPGGGYAVRAFMPTFGCGVWFGCVQTAAAANASRGAPLRMRPCRSCRSLRPCELCVRAGRSEDRTRGSVRPILADGSEPPSARRRFTLAGSGGVQSRPRHKVADGSTLSVVERGGANRAKSRAEECLCGVTAATEPDSFNDLGLSH